MRYLAPIFFFGILGVFGSAFRAEILAGSPLFVTALLLTEGAADWRLWLFYILTASVFFSFLNDFSLPVSFALFFAVGLWIILMRELLGPGIYRKFIIGAGGLLLWQAGIFLAHLAEGSRPGDWMGDIFWHFAAFGLLILALRILNNIKASLKFP